MSRRVRDKRQRRSKHGWIVGVGALAVVVCGVLLWSYWQRTSPARAITQVQFPPHTLDEALALSDDQVEKCDVGLLNLLCAEGLPGAEGVNVEDCLKTLDDLAQRVKWETDRNSHRFEAHPEQFRNSIGYYRMMVLGGILVQDLGIRYNPDLALPQMDGKVPTMDFGRDSRNLFIHGLLGGDRYGTCASMPVLIVAIGRRLGYPMNLAAAKLHLYVRYEEAAGKHFNVEPTVAEGFMTPPDDDYHNGRFPATEEEVKGYGWLRPLSNKESLSQFLCNRGVCLGNAKRYAEAKRAFERSIDCATNTPMMKRGLELYLEDVRLAPLGDRIDNWMSEVRGWTVPPGARYNYFENRKMQVCYFIGSCPDAAASEQAVNGLREELELYRKLLPADASAMLSRGQRRLELTVRGKAVPIPAEILPPPLNRGTFPPAYFDQIEKAHAEDQPSIADACWSYFHATTTNWMIQALLLPDGGEEDNFPLTLPGRR